jgi:hypothetical protein
MPKFRVCVGAKDLIIKFEAGPMVGGFYRNVFVSAPDSRAATAKAFAETLEDARAKGAIESISEENLFVEEIEPDYRWLPRFRKQGFIFYPKDGDDDCDEEGEED